MEGKDSFWGAVIFTLAILLMIKGSQKRDKELEQKPAIAFYKSWNVLLVVIGTFIVLSQMRNFYAKK